MRHRRTLPLAPALRGDRHAPGRSRISLATLACLDAPLADCVVQRHGFGVSGWIIPSAGTTLRSVDVRSDGMMLGSTALVYARPDVDGALALAPGTAAGFLLDVAVPVELRDRGGICLTVDARLSDESVVRIAERDVRFSLHDYRIHALGTMFEPGFASILKRDDIYGSGPPAPLASPVVLDIIFRFIEPGARVIDVGCGIGAYGKAFRERGQPWTGCEVQAEFVDIACGAGLDAHVITDGRLPFADAAFDAAIAIEVIEHAEDLPALLAEVARVAPRLALFSVPNIETIPVTSAFYAIPWHMLEATHVNFFTHASLRAALLRHYPRVEVFEYGPLPDLRSIDQLPLNNHLFAVAMAGA